MVIENESKSKFFKLTEILFVIRKNCTNKMDMNTA